MEHYENTLSFLASVSFSGNKSISFFNDQPCQNTPSVNTANIGLIELVYKKSQDAGYRNIKELAKAFGYSNVSKVKTALVSFFQSGEIDKSYMKKLMELLNISQGEVKMHKKQHNQYLNADKFAFIENFDLLMRYSDIILGNKAYYNITFYGLVFSASFLGRHKPFTLGELLYYYKKGAWTEKGCCGRIHIIEAEGSSLSGINTFSGFCSVCKKRIKDSSDFFREMIGFYMQFKPSFDYEPSQIRLHYLIDELIEYDRQKALLVL
ncbi:hypothetical protein MASR2M29_04570 [Spirochaetota bacterium]